MTIIAPKLSTRAMGYTKGKLSVEAEKLTGEGRLYLGRVAGIVTGFKETVDGDTGALQIGLKGSFKAISTCADENGVLQEVRSGVCYLPGGIQETVEAAFLEERGEGENAKKNATIAFAVDLYMKRANNKAGYSYEAETLMQPSANDPLANLFATAEASKPLPSLAAPAPAPETPKLETPAPEAPAPETEKAKVKG